VRSSASAAIAAGLLLASAGAIAGLQHRAAKHAADVKEMSDVYVLPPPEHLSLMSLGYRSALADLMWADVLTTQGFRMHEKRHYDTLVPELDAITYLDPQFREPYIVGWSLVTFQNSDDPVGDARATRRLLELGVKNRPLDAEIWENLGAFVEFHSPSSILQDPAEQDQWRRDGADYLARAVELAGDNAMLASRALGGGVNLSRLLGDANAAVRFFDKVIEVSDSEQVKAEAEVKRGQILATQAEMQANFEDKDRRAGIYLHAHLKEVRKRAFAALPMNAALAIGPPAPADLCAGGQSKDPLCAPDWIEWSKRVLAEPTAP